ncbi:MAG: DUF2461 domain-containing protein [Bacteroidia bacterium]|nr:DUF2461 domain-containing protein [Bacteroidia bacterium]
MKAVLQFLRQLEHNNDRTWFKAHDEAYQKAKASMLGLTEQLLEKSIVIAPELDGLKAKDCLFRIFRDVRFSHNKAPYKTNMGAYFAKGGKKSVYAGYYIHIQPSASFIAGGLWMPEATELHLVRQQIYFQPDEFKRIVLNKNFKTVFPTIEGERLKNMPKGFESGHPAEEWLKLKSFIVSQSFSDVQVSHSDFLNEAMQAIQLMRPWVNFLNQAIDMQESAQ